MFLTKDLSGLSVIKSLNILLVKKNIQGLRCGGNHVYNRNVRHKYGNKGRQEKVKADF